MKSNTTYRTQLRAVFLAAIMVISVVGMSVAFTGAAAAGAASGDQPDWDNTNPYEGQVIESENNYASAGEEFDLRIVDSFTDTGSVSSSSSVEDVFADDNGVVEIDTAGLDTGQYFLDNDTITRSNVEEGDTFEVRLQTIDTFEFDDDTVTDDGGDAITELEIESNRGSSDYVIDAGDGDLDNSELLDIFVSDANTDFGDTFDINQSGTGEMIIDSGKSNITVDDYKTILGDTQIQNLVDFEDNDVTEPLNISADEPLSNYTAASNFTIDLSNGDEVVINTSTTWGDLVTPNTDDDKNVNPFNALLIAENQDEEDDPDDRIVLLDLRDTEADVDFTDIDAGDYTFNLNVADTEASASADIAVREEDQDASFSQGTYQAGAGDIAHFEFELDDTDEAWLQIGDADSDFVDFLYVEVDDADEPVEVAVNTRLLGAPGSSVDTDAVYDVENTEQFYSLLHTQADEDFSDTSFMQSTDVPIFADDDNTHDDPSEFFDELGLIDDADDASNALDLRNETLTRPLQAIDYELQIASDDVDDDEGIFDSDSGAGEATDQLDAAVLELQAASIGDIRTWTAFEENADDEDDVADLLEIVTERDEIAYEDRLVVQVEATGLYGGLIAGGPDGNEVDEDAVDFDRLGEGLSTDIAVDFFGAENIDFTIESDTATGQEPLEVNLGSDDSDTYMLIGPDQDQFFLIVDTGSDSAFSNGDAPEAGASFTAEFEYDADDGDDRFAFGDDPFENPETNYPYLLQGETLSSSTEFDIEPREVSFDNLNADDEIQAENVEDSEISGTTNVAPGSDAELRISSTDASSSFREGVSIEINEDGEISATFDFSGQEVGDEFDTRFRASGSNVDTVDSVIVAEGDLGVEEPVEDDDEEPVDDEPEPVDDDEDEVVDDDDDVEEPTDDETPGFGALVALVALIGAALLAARRQN